MADDSDAPCLTPVAFAGRAAAERHAVVHMLRRLLPTREDAEDVLQDSLIYAYLNLRALRRPDLFGAWLRTIAYNRAMQWHRVRYREERTRPTLWRPPVMDIEQRRADARMDVQAIVGRLAPADRRLVALRYRGDLDPTEIAKILGIAAGTVRVRLHRARQTLRTAYLGGDKGGHGS